MTVMDPMARDEAGWTNPAEGVMATRPTTAPLAAPTAVTFLWNGGKSRESDQREEERRGRRVP